MNAIVQTDRVITTSIRSLQEGNVFSHACLSVCLVGDRFDLFKLVHLRWLPAPALAPKTWSCSFTWGPHFPDTCWQAGGWPFTNRRSCWEFSFYRYFRETSTMSALSANMSFVSLVPVQNWTSKSHLKFNATRSWCRSQLINNYSQDVPANFKSNIQLNLSNVNWAFHLRIVWPLSKNLPKDTDYRSTLAIWPFNLVSMNRGWRLWNCHVNHLKNGLEPGEEITSANPTDTDVNNKSPKFTCYELLWLGEKHHYLQEQICPFPFRSKLGFFTFPRMKPTKCNKTETFSVRVELPLALSIVHDTKSTANDSCKKIRTFKSVSIAEM